MSNKKIDYRQIFIESIFIVFAVSLAFLLNEWRQGIKTDQLVARVTQTLKDETVSNKEKVARAIEYHEGLIYELKNGIHIMTRFPIQAIPFDPRNDSEMKKLFEASLFSDLGEVPNVSVIRNNGRRYITFSKRLNEVVIENDTVTIYGKGNIQLKAADISNNSWQMANATNALIEMDYDLVTFMGETSNLISDYNKTTEKALNILYGASGEILSVLEDMHGLEMELLSKCDTILSLTNYRYDSILNNVPYSTQSKEDIRKSN